MKTHHICKIIVLNFNIQYILQMGFSFFEFHKIFENGIKFSLKISAGNLLML